MYSPPSSPLSIGGVIDEGIRLFRASFSRCWLLAVIPGLVLVAFTIAFPVSIPLLSALRHPGAVQAETPRLLALDLLSILLWLVFQGAVLARQAAIIRGEESFNFARAVSLGVSRLPQTIVGGVLFFLALVVSMIALLIPALYIVPRLQLWLAAVFVEDAGGATALGSSWRLTQGHWWRAAVILTVAAIIVWVFSVAFSLLGGIVALEAHVRSEVRTVLLQVFALGSSAIAYPLDAAIWLAMYHDFKLRREGGDLASRAGALSRTT